MKDKLPPSKTWGDVVSSQMCVWHCIPAALGHPLKYSTQRALSRRCHPGKGTREKGYLLGEMYLKKHLFLLREKWMLSSLCHQPYWPHESLLLAGCF